MRPHTLGERRRLYLLARLIVKRYHRKHLTLDMVAKTLAISPRQLQRVYAQFAVALRWVRLARSSGRPPIARATSAVAHLCACSSVIGGCGRSD
jgi:hypothetical protein